MLFTVNYYPRFKCPICGHTVSGLASTSPRVPGEYFLGICDEEEGGCGRTFNIRVAFKAIPMLYSLKKEPAVEWSAE